jgi:uncharacterized protein YukE
MGRRNLLDNATFTGLLAARGRTNCLLRTTGIPDAIQSNDWTFTNGEDLMAQAIVDPEQLRHFALQLKRFSGVLGEASTKLSQQMQQLAITWRDQEHIKFSAEFEQELKQLTRMIEASERHVPYLMRKAELIEEYQRGNG